MGLSKVVQTRYGQCFSLTRLHPANFGHGNANQEHGCDHGNSGHPMVVLSATDSNKRRRYWHKQYRSVPFEHRIDSDQFLCNFLQGFDLLSLQRVIDDIRNINSGFDQGMLVI